MSNLNCGVEEFSSESLNYGDDYYANITKDNENLENFLELTGKSEDKFIQGIAEINEACPEKCEPCRFKSAVAWISKNYSAENCSTMANFVCEGLENNAIIDNSMNGEISTQKASKFDEENSACEGILGCDKSNDVVAQIDCKSYGAGNGEKQVKCGSLEAGEGIDDSGLNLIVEEALSLELAEESLLKEQQKMLESMRETKVVETVEDEYGQAVEAVDANAFNAVVDMDAGLASDAVLNAKKVFKCDLCNMTLDRGDVCNWTLTEWVKFFLKAVKSISFSIDYYDRLLERHVQSSFYSEHIEKFGSIEQFFDSMAEIIERKMIMKELRTFVKRMYKELSDLEVSIVDRFVFDADNIDEITEKVSLRTMYRKADKIIPKLVEFLEARGYTADWCNRKFGVIL